MEVDVPHGQDTGDAVGGTRKDEEDGQDVVHLRTAQVDVMVTLYGERRVVAFVPAHAGRVEILLRATRHRRQRDEVQKGEGTRYEASRSRQRAEGDAQHLQFSFSSR